MGQAQPDNSASDEQVWEQVRRYAEYLPTASYRQALQAHDDLIAMVQAPVDPWPRWLISELCKVDRFLLLIQILNQIHCRNPWVYERCREVEADPDDHLDLWARGHFKLLANDEPVFTPSGWMTHGSLEPGDFVFSPSGYPVPVLATSPIRDNPVLYNVIFRNGACITADENHLWDFVCNDRTRTPEGRVGRCTRTGTTSEMLSWCEKYHPVRVNIPQPLQFEDADLLIPPYTLGAWLGDGSKAQGVITGIDEEIFNNVRKDGFEVRARDYKTHGVYGLVTKLKQLGVYCNKHIPLQYLSASVEQRRALLQGLMDTDGHMHISDGKAIFNQIPSRLCDDTEALIRGLGYDVRRYQYTNAHRGYVFLAFRPDEHVFRIRRKRDGVGTVKEWFRNGNGFVIDSIEKAQVEQGKCIQVLGGRYLVGKELIPTHNSTLITFGGTFQEIIRNPEITIGIFANDRPIAKSFLRQIKAECETNYKLHAHWPHIFWEHPRRQSPKWSEDEGIIVQRKGNPRESTVSAWGLVDAQPTGKHFDLRIYDDVVTEDSVTTAEQIQKTTERWELSQSLCKIEIEGGDPVRQQLVGTRYNFGDTYGIILKRGGVKARIYPATKDGTFDGEPVLLSRDAWAKKKLNESRQTIATQQLLNPLAGEQQEMRSEWIRRWEVRPERINVCITVDPANSQKKGSCNTAFIVQGVDMLGNWYFLDGACHKMSLKDRWEMLLYLWMKWSRAPGVLLCEVGYERYGLQADIDYFEIEQQRMPRNRKISIPVTEVSWVSDGPNAKDDRIRRIIPDLQKAKYFWPYEGGLTSMQLKCKDQSKDYLISAPVKRKNELGKIYNVVDYIIDNEYVFFPATTAKDALDAMSRRFELTIGPPGPVYSGQELVPQHAGEL